MKFLAAFLALGFFAFGQAPWPDRKNSPDATTRLLIQFFRGDTNHDGRICVREFGWPTVLFGRSRLGNPKQALRSFIEILEAKGAQQLLHVITFIAAAK